MRSNIKIMILFLSISCAFFGTRSDASSLIMGHVSDRQGNALSYANIYIVNSQDGTISDEKGYFRLETTEHGEKIVRCTYIGYHEFERSIDLKDGLSYEIEIVLKETQIQGDRVMVTASAFTASDEEGVTLSSMDVVRTPGAAADIFWAIKSFPGLAQVEEGAGLFVRGGDVSETITLLDGAIINHPYKYESPTGGYFGTFNPFLLKGTFFSSGGYSAQYGNALSAALVMESQDLPSKREMSFGLGLAATSLYLGVPIINDKLGLSFSGNRSNTKMLFEMNGSDRNFSQYPYSSDMNLNAYYKIHENSYLKFFIYRAYDKIGVEVDDPDYYTHFRGNTSNQFYNLKYSNLVRDKLLVHLNVAFSDFGRDMKLSTMDLDLNNNMLQGRLSLQYELNNTILCRGGLWYIQDKTSINGTVPENESDLDPYALTSMVDTDYNSYRTAPYLEMQFMTFAGIQVTSGLRGEYESMSKQYILDPRLSFICPLTSRSNITCAMGIFHQTPDAQYFDPYIGNENLQHSRADHVIIGYAYTHDDRIFRVEGYYKDYNFLLLEDDEKNYSNDGEGYAGGFDLFYKDRYKTVSGWVSYSWLRARRKWMDLHNMASPYFDITHNLSLVLNIDLPHNLTLGAGYRYATGKPYTSGIGMYNDSRVPDYQKLDLTLSYLVSFFENNLSIFYLSASNILGRKNIFDYQYSKDYKRRDAVESSFGRNYYFGVSFNL